MIWGKIYSYNTGDNDSHINSCDTESDRIYMDNDIAMESVLDLGNTV